MTGRAMAHYDLDARGRDPRGSPKGPARGRFEERERKGSSDTRDGAGLKDMKDGRDARETSSSPKGEEGLQTTRSMARQLLMSIQFDLAIGVVISLNAVSIGTEQTLQLSGHSVAPVQVVESLFLVVYIFELGLRCYVHGLSCFKDNWVKFDAFLLAMGILNSWIIEPFVKEMPNELGLIMVLRVGRLLRLAKMARFFSQIQDFWKLIRGLFGSLSIMTYTFVLLVIILYVFSSLGFELITKHDMNIGADPDPHFQEQVNMYFRSLPQIMCTLIQFVTLDDMHLVYKPLIEKDPFLAIYFVLVILVMSIVVVNLVAAVIFSCCLEQNVYESDELQRQQEERWAELIRDLKEMFIRLDCDNSGQLTRDNMMNISPEDQEQLSEALGFSSPMEIFNALDIDRSGTISINEFFDGIWDVMLTKGDVEMKRMEKQVESIHWRLKESFSLQHDARLGMNRILKQLEMDSLSELATPNLMQAFDGLQSPPLWAAELKDSMKSLIKSLKAAVPGVDVTEPSSPFPALDRPGSKKRPSSASSTPKKGRSRDSSPRHAPKPPDTSSSPRSPKRDGTLFASLVRDASRDQNQAEVWPTKMPGTTAPPRKVDKQPHGYSEMKSHQGEFDLASAHNSGTHSSSSSTGSRVHKI